ncbi:hypothetical protein D7X96_25370 [Corallococcus interemptor]|uniref:Toxin-antitoxin system YwqK family antitoxin n=1 Tax=Corallococcus interemptor TaxID=2316720 RepID=A0A3A8QAN1_9BACT|nr:hypothetical protein [Corallococcus interemptor]RKH64631.1 hypothetical protein D7X96_25370 [Corallococcus interemptor]
MQSKKLMQIFALGLSLAAPVASAADSTVQLTCPAGTKQAGSKEEGLFCRKLSDSSGRMAEGPYRSFHANGKKAAVGQLLNGLQTGTWYFYDEAGNQYGKTEFRESNYHGTRVLYFANGNPHFIEQYQNGLKDGVVQEFSEDGKIVRESRFEKGKEVAAK